MVYYTDSLDEKLTEQLNEILEKKVDDYKPSFFERICGFDPKNQVREVDTIITEYKGRVTQKIINSIKPFFEKHGLTMNDNDGLITYRSYSYNNGNNNEDISYKNIKDIKDIKTCILITQKDESLQNGNIEFNNKNISPINNGSLFIIDGSTNYKIQGCTGIGTFNIIHIILFS